MRRGTVGNRILTRSIVKHIPKENGSGIGPGIDYAVMDGIVIAHGFSDHDIYVKGNDKTTLSSRGSSDIIHLSISELAYVRARNNLAMSGAVTAKISVMIQACQDCPEQTMRSEMLALTERTRADDVAIIGGNTAYFGEGDGIAVIITAYGKAPMNSDIYNHSIKKNQSATDTLLQRINQPATDTLLKGINQPATDTLLKGINQSAIDTPHCSISQPVADTLYRGIRPGDAVIIIGEAGHFGASYLATNYRKDLTAQRFSDSYIDSSIINVTDIDVCDIAGELLNAGAYYMHDVTYGGIYRTLYEISELSGLGIRINHDDIPIRQDTIEICEFLNLNPYQLIGTGGIVVLCHEDIEDSLVNHISKFRPCKAAGHLTEENSRVIVTASGERSLTMYDIDEMYKPVSRQTF